MTERSDRYGKWVSEDDAGWVLVEPSQEFLGEQEASTAKAAAREAAVEAERAAERAKAAAQEVTARLTVLDKLDTLPEVTVAEVAPLFDPWRQPQGAHDAYPEGAIVRHHGTLWRSTTADNVWQPGEAGWHRYGASPDDGPQPWVQPSGAADAYPAGAQVTHNGDTWTSDLDGNVWEPGVYGWTAT